jgi:glycosyltransferase involved in cell wall biosynthesis
MKENIIICGNFIFPDGNAAGKRVMGLGYLFREIGYSVNYLGFPSNKKIIESHGFNTQTFKKHSKFGRFINFRSYFIDFLSFFNKLNTDGRIKCVVIYGTPTFSNWTKKVIYFCNRNGVKVYFDCVDWIEKTGINIFYDVIKSIETRYLKSNIALKSDGIIAINSFISSYYKNAGIKTVVIPPIFGDKKNSIFVKNSGEIRFIYYGSPFSTKKRIKTKYFKDRLDLILEMIDKLDFEYSFHIFGLTKEDYLKMVPKHQVLLQKNVNIFFFGLIENNKLINEIQSSDYTVLLRDNNKVSNFGFPTKIAESIYLGVPVITTDTSDIFEYLREDIDGFKIDINDIYAINKINLINDKNLIKNLKKNCSENESFNYKIYIKKMIKFMED